MSRVRIPLTIETHASVKKEPSGSVTVPEPVSGATISGTNRVTSIAAKFYTSETSETPVASPVTDENGNIPYWIEEGAWNVTIEGGTPSIAPVTYAFDALSGRGTAKIASGAVVGASIAAEAVGTTQLAKEGVTSVKIANEAVTGAKIAAATVKTSNLEGGAVTFPKMAGPYGTVLADVASVATSSTGNAVIWGPTNFTAHGGHCFVIWCATGYTPHAGGSFAFYLDLDGTYTNSQSFLSIDIAGNRCTFPTVITPLGVLSGTHALRIRSSSELVTDELDHAYLAVFELP